VSRGDEGGAGAPPFDEEDGAGRLTRQWRADESFVRRADFRDDVGSVGDRERPERTSLRLGKEAEWAKGLSKICRRRRLCDRDR
jgi:hypothetical protein